jgi:hypothetical protein
MSIIITCKCGERFDVEEGAGAQVICPRCGEVAEIPQQHPTREDHSEEYKLASEPTAAAQSAEPGACPYCKSPLAPEAVLCVKCGFDLRTGRKMQTVTGAAVRAEEERSLAERERTVAMRDARTKHALSEEQRPLIARWRQVVGLVIVLGIGGVVTVAVVRGVHTLVRREALYLRITGIVELGWPKAALTAEDVPHLIWYVREADSRYETVPERRKESLKSLIENLDATIGFEPLLEFPRGSFPYDAVLSLVTSRTDVEWRLAKSCDPSPNVRSYGADGLVAALPFVKIDEAGRSQLEEETSLEEKRRRFEAYREKCQAEATKSLLGEYELELEAFYVEATVVERADGTQIGMWLNGVPRGKRLSARIAGALRVSCSDQEWSIKFLGEGWSGHVEEISGIRASVPVAEIATALVESDEAWKPALKHALDKSTVHLRFRKDAFVIEVTPIAAPRIVSMPVQGHVRKRQHQITAPGLNGFRAVLSRIEDAQPKAP